MKAQLWGLAVLVACAPVWAVNKCTGADGQVTYQQAPCPLSAKAGEQVKTWVNSGYGQQAQPRSKRVEPNLSLVGPPEAAPLLTLYRRWADAERLAFSTGRIALAGPAASMQALQREAEALQVPECLADARRVLVDLVTKSSEAILEFMGKQEVTAMAYQIVHRQQLMPAFEAAVVSAHCK